MKILITGGLGYLGGRIADYLKHKHPDARIFLTTRKKGSCIPLWAKTFTILPMDLLDEKSVKRCVNKTSPDIIMHLAALNEIDSMADPESALEVNALGTFRLLCAAEKGKVKKFIYFSTFHVYGDISDKIITEATPTRPFHPYALTHRAAEDFVNFFRRYNKMDTLIFRLSNGYGYPMDTGVNRWTLVFNDLCRQAVTTGKIILKSSGKQYRDFISLRDIGRAVDHFIYVAPDKWGDGLYNLGGGKAISILNVARKVSQAYGKKYKKRIIGIERKKDGHDSGIRPFTYSIGKLRKTGFRLKGDMDLEISKTMELCEEFLHDNN